MRGLKIVTKKAKGITLIALVITIIVLLILAAVSIATLTGQNGILTKASESKTKTDRATAKEKVQIEVAGSMGTDLAVDMDLLKDNLKKNLGLTDEDITENDDGSITIPVDGFTFTISPNGKITDNGEVPKEPEKVEGSSLDWQVNEAGDTIIQYIGSGFDGDTVVIPNYVDGKKITVLGDGTSPIFVESSSDYIQHKKLKISEGIEEINNDAFVKCSGFIGDLIIPNGVKTIKSGAFGSCSGFTGDLTIPSSVTILQGGAFTTYGIQGTLTIGVPDILDGGMFANFKFKKLILKDTVKTIGSGAFSSCTNLIGDLIIPNSVTTIKSGAFSGCTGLTGDLTIPNSVTTLQSGAFSNTRFQGTLTIGAPNIPNYMFRNFKFTKLILKDTVKTIDPGAFASCTGLTGDLVIPNSVTTIGAGAFSECIGFTGDLIIPSSVTTLQVGAFSGVGFQGTLTIGVPNILDGMFSNLKFTKLILKDTVKTIGSGAFFGCSKLTGDLVIPNSVTSIGSKAFGSCTGFTSIKIMNSGAQVADNSFEGCNVSPTYGN